MAEWSASRMLDPRVERSSPGLSVTLRLCSWAKHFATNCPCVFSDRTLKIVGPFYLVSMPEEVKDPTPVIQNVTCS